jgi:hypothetical protein
MGIVKFPSFPGQDGNDGPTRADPGGGAGDDDMEKRLTVVEHAIVRIDATLEFMREHMATKADVEAGINSTQRWMIATVLGLFIGFGGMFFGMANFLKPSPAPATTAAPAAAVQMPPIIINVPAAQAAAPSAPAASR